MFVVALNKMSNHSGKYKLSTVGKSVTLALVYPKFNITFPWHYSDSLK